MGTGALEVRDAYLERLGLDAEPPSVDALFRLHRAHVERVPYETLWIHMGEQWGVDVAASAGRIATERRGGYCFHLNGALSELLGSLGYDVVRHVGGVHGPAGASDDDMANHLVLTVNGLPTNANPDGTWYVDAGLGDALYEPLPLIAGAYDQAPFHLVLGATPGAVGDWHLTHDPQGGFPGMAWRSAPTAMSSFASKNEWLSTSPESGFVKVLTVQRRDATGVDVIRGQTFLRIGDGARTSTLATRAELADALREIFGFDVDAIGDDALGRLWTNVHRAHEEWEAAGRP
jgi:N-hydroxyarylamine O-acetyltransferase